MASGKDIRAGRAFVEIGSDDKSLRAGLDAASARLKLWGAGIAAIGAKLATSAFAGLGSLFGASTLFANLGSELLDASAATGVSVEALSELKFAAEQSGASFNDLVVGIHKMNVLVGDAAGGSESARKTLSDLGLTLEELVGLKPDQVFEKIGGAIGAMGDDFKRSAIAQDFFGRGGRKLIPALRQMTELRQEARDSGQVWTAADAAAADKFGDELSKLWSTAKMGLAVIGGELAPIFGQLANPVQRGVQAVTAWVKENSGLVTVALLAVGAVGALGVALLATGVILSGVGAVLGFVAGGLGLTQVLAVASAVVWGSWVAVLAVWKTVMVAVNVVLVLFNAQVALWNFLLGGAVVATTTWTIATLAAKAAAWLFNAALVVLNGLLSASVLLAAAGTLIMIGTALAVAAAAAVALYQSARLVWETLANLGTTAGPLGAIKAVFGEWIAILKEVIAALRDDLPKAMEVLKAGFNLAVAQMRALWTPLWEFIKGGFFVLAEVVSTVFEQEFKNALFRIKREVAIATSIFGIGDQQKRDEIKAMEQVTKNTRLAAADRLDAEFAKLNRKFKVEKDPEEDALRAKLEEARAKLREAQAEVIAPPRLEAELATPQLDQALASAKTETVGTFDAAFAGQLGAKNLAEKQLDVQKQIEANTRRTANRAVEAAFT